MRISGTKFSLHKLAFIILKAKCNKSSSLKNIYFSGLVIICRHFKTSAELKDHLKNLQGYSLRRLEIKGFDTDSIPTDVWKGVEIEELSLEKVEVNDASFRRGQRHFQGLEKSLQLLDIRNSFKNGHRPLLNLQLDHLENLEVNQYSFFFLHFSFNVDISVWLFACLPGLNI